MADRIEVVGLRDFRRDLGRVGPEYRRMVRQINLDAAEVVAKEARRRAPRGPHEGGGRVVPLWTNIRALASQTRGQVATGSARAPHGPVYEFGGTIRRHASSSRTQVRAQPYMYPALDAKADEVVEVFAEGVDRVTRRAFPERF